MRVPYHDDYLILECIHTKQHLFFITWATLGLHDTILDWIIEATHVVSVSHETNVTPKLVIILHSYSIVAILVLDSLALFGGIM